MNLHDSMTVSVVIPTYNRADRLEGAIRSALAQNPKPLEIIIVDDGSSDLPDVTWLTDIDPCVRVIRHERNRGGNVARNTGIDAARGDLVALLDADDRWFPNKLAIQLSQIGGRTSGSYFACANALFDGGGWDGRPTNARPPHQGEDISRYFLVHCYGFLSSTLLLPTQLAKAVRFDERLKKHQDQDFGLRLVRGGAEFLYWHEPLAAWWSEEDPTRVTRLKSIEPTLTWLRVAGNLMASDAAAALYFREAFRRHVKGEPLSALALALKLGLRDRQSMSWILKRIPKLVRS
ncbi:glycosyltransferase family 2 protein [Bradyrhizobium sp. CCGUVB23]|uniref:glycosyltransferase family 2 protein n=1 Tax=Bradyrhizobium sp. CCGUVB23 TaxID=2949630 RepID=UPI0020B189DF|nr:glycosyltransferase family 2 protein [Bradyrhizobium sp. CCGUVB23]MCP3460065.1 glycosyltransferase [Bradyrhizobium sp. CCGUVB23]